VSVLAVDVGNTVTRYGLFNGADLMVTWDVATRDSLTADEIRLSLHGFLDVLLIRKSFADSVEEISRPEDDTLDPTDGIVSCVVPSLLRVYVDALESEFGCRPLIVGPGLKTGLKMHYNDPAEIGSDRIADMIAARASYRSPLAIVDLGTATNITVLDADGVFIGGIIAPGLALSAKALSHAAARLPTVEIALPASVIGKNTHDAMQAGFVLGETARIDGLIEMIWDEIGEEGEVIVTGTDAGAVAEVLAHDVHVDDTLTLRGLSLLYDLNRKKELRITLC
jgi:type III pantothenate kinase